MVNGEVLDAQTILYDDEGIAIDSVPHADRVKVYFLWQQIYAPKGDPTGTPTYQLDETQGEFSSYSSPDATYSGDVMANANPDPRHSGTYFIRVEAYLGGAFVAYQDKAVEFINYNPYP